MIVDPENNIWLAEIPVRCDTRGHLVLCNEEIIGSVECTGPNDFLATVSPSTRSWAIRPEAQRGRTIGGYPTIEAAARAITIEVIGTLAGFPFEEKDVNDYIATGGWG